jgi:hypothetical protein
MTQATASFHIRFSSSYYFGVPNWSHVPSPSIHLSTSASNAPTASMKLLSNRRITRFIVSRFIAAVHGGYVIHLSLL